MLGGVAGFVVGCVAGFIVGCVADVTKKLKLMCE